MSFQSQLTNLVQMATIEQLNLMMEQLKKFNSEPNTNTNKCDKKHCDSKCYKNCSPDIEELGKQKVVLVYEDAKQPSEEKLLHKILEKMEEQSQVITRLEKKLEEINKAVIKLDVWGKPGIEEPVQYVSPELTHYKEPYYEEYYPEAPSVSPSEPCVLESKPPSEPPVSEEEHVTLDIQEIENLENLEDLEEVEEDAVEDTAVEEDVEEEDTTVEEDEEDAVEEDDAVEEVEEDAVKDVEEEEEQTASEEEVVSEEEPEQVEKEVTKEDVEEVLDEDEEVFEIEIDDITYYATDEENGILYAVDENGDVGKKVGIIKDGEPIFS